MSSETPFFKLTSKLSNQIVASLQGSELKLWLHLVTVESFGNRFRDCPSVQAITSALKISRATFYRAFKKLQDLGLIAAHWGRLKIRNLMGIYADEFTSGQEFHADMNNNFMPTLNNDAIFSDQEIVSSMRQPSHPCDNRLTGETLSIYKNLKELSQSSGSGSIPVVPSEVQGTPIHGTSLTKKDEVTQTNKPSKKDQTSGAVAAELLSFVEELLENRVFMLWMAQEWDKSEDPKRPHFYRGEAGAEANLRAKPHLARAQYRRFCEEMSRRVEVLNQRIAGGTISQREFEEGQIIEQFSAVPLVAVGDSPAPVPAVSSSASPAPVPAVSSSAAPVPAVSSSASPAPVPAVSSSAAPVPAVSSSAAPVPAVSSSAAPVPAANNAPKDSKLENPEAYTYYSADAEMLQALYGRVEMPKEKPQQSAPHQQEAEWEIKRQQALKFLGSENDK